MHQYVLKRTVLILAIGLSIFLVMFPIGLLYLVPMSKIASYLLGLVFAALFAFVLVSFGELSVLEVCSGVCIYCAVLSSLLAQLVSA